MKCEKSVKDDKQERREGRGGEIKMGRCQMKRRGQRRRTKENDQEGQ